MQISGRVDFWSGRFSDAFWGGHVLCVLPLPGYIKTWKMQTTPLWSVHNLWNNLKVWSIAHNPLVVQINTQMLYILSTVMEKFT